MIRMMHGAKYWKKRAMDAEKELIEAHDKIFDEIHKRELAVDFLKDEIRRLRKKTKKVEYGGHIFITGDDRGERE